MRAGPSSFQRTSLRELRRVSGLGELSSSCKRLANASSASMRRELAGSWGTAKLSGAAELQVLEAGACIILAHAQRRWLIGRFLNGTARQLISSCPRLWM